MIAAATAGAHVSLWQSVVLGAIEGVTEFLPVSSTGHLTIAEDLMGLRTDNDAITAYTAVIQDGAILAAILYFWRDIVRIVTGWAGGLVRAERRDSADYRMGWLVIVGTIPVGLFGFFGRHVIEDDLRSLWYVAAGLVVWSGVIIAAERTATQRRHEPAMRMKDAVVIGLFQVVSLVPGTSRSGTTISAGLLRGLDRVTATRFSFFLGIPALLAAGVFELPKALHDNVGGVATLVGVAVSFAVAYVSIAWLLRFVAGHSIGRFVPYRLALGLAVVGMLLADVVQPT